MASEQKLRLRPLEREDLPVFVRWFSDPEVLEYLGLHNPISMAREEKWFDKVLAAPEDEHPYVIEVEEKGEWRIIGNMSFFDLNTTDRGAEIGIVIGDKASWSRGYGTDAMRAMVRRGFNDLGLHRIYLHVFAENTRGIRCYEKVGFVREGLLREAGWKNGKFRDVILMSILFPDWVQSNRGEK
jgi:RimJ/RimL family protein N-acetyltransferase